MFLWECFRIYFKDRNIEFVKTIAELVSKTVSTVYRWAEDPNCDGLDMPAKAIPIIVNYTKNYALLELLCKKSNCACVQMKEFTGSKKDLLSSVSLISFKFAEFLKEISAGMADGAIDDTGRERIIERVDVLVSSAEQIKYMLRNK